MSTSAIIQVKGQNSDQLFYCPYDGHPDGVEKDLKKFLSWVKEKKIRKSTIESAGWLVLIGAYRNEPDKEVFNGWKASRFEPVSFVLPWIDYFYTIDLENEEIWVYGKHVTEALEYVKDGFEISAKADIIWD